MLVEDEAYANFIDSIRSDATRKHYLFLIQRYAEFRQTNSLQEIFSTDIGVNPSKEIKKFLAELLKSGLSQGSINNYRHAIRHFYDVNDDENELKLNWKTLGMFARRDEIRKKTIAYTRSQIQLMLLKASNEKTRAIILLLASSGIRLGGIPLLKLGDLTKVGDLYEITVYRSAVQGYVTFCTAETAKTIDSYLEYRQRCGEKLTAESPLFRREFDPLRVNLNIKPIGLDGISYLVNYTLVKAGIVSPNSQPNKRHNIQRNHGFRKHFNTALMNSNVHPTFKELLMGHSVKLDDYYYDKNSDKSRQMLLAEYSKAIPDLTISDADRLKNKVKDLADREEETQAIKKRIGELEAGHKELSNDYEILLQMYEHDPQERRKLKTLYLEANRNGTRKPGQLLYLKKSEYSPNSLASYEYGDRSSE